MSVIDVRIEHDARGSKLGIRPLDDAIDEHVMPLELERTVIRVSRGS